MGKAATGTKELPKVVNMALIAEVLSDWQNDYIGVSGSTCSCPVAKLMRQHYDVEVSVGYETVTFFQRSALEAAFPSAVISPDVGQLILKLDNEFEGRAIPTAWFKAEVERVVG